MINYYNSNPYITYPYSNSQFNSFSNIQQQQIGLNGKIVDSKDMVKAIDVPIGSFGIFPKADLKEVYLKTWNPDGTTSVLTFLPTIEQTEEKSFENTIDTIVNKINQLEVKMDAFLNQERVITNSKKEGGINANEF
jgi:hypothetical protein